MISLSSIIETLLPSFTYRTNINSFTTSKFKTSSISRVARYNQNSHVLSLVDCEISYIDILSPSLHKTLLHMQTIYLSNNSLQSLLNINQFPDLVTLSVAHNRLFYFDQVQPVQSLIKLTKLFLTGNTVTNVPFYFDFILAWLPNLTSLDGEGISLHRRSTCKLKYNKAIEIFDRLSLQEFQIFAVLRASLLEDCHKELLNHRRIRSNKYLLKLLRICVVHGVFHWMKVPGNHSFHRIIQANLVKLKDWMALSHPMKSDTTSDDDIRFEYDEKVANEYSRIQNLIVHNLLSCNPSLSDLLHPNTSKSRSATPFHLISNHHPLKAVPARRQVMSLTSVKGLNPLSQLFTRFYYTTNQPPTLPAEAFNETLTTSNIRESKKASWTHQAYPSLPHLSTDQTTTKRLHQIEEAVAELDEEACEILDLLRIALNPHDAPFHHPGIQSPFPSRWVGDLNEEEEEEEAVPHHLHIDLGTTGHYNRVNDHQHNPSNEKNNHIDKENLINNTQEVVIETSQLKPPTSRTAADRVSISVDKPKLQSNATLSTQEGSIRSHQLQKRVEVVSLEINEWLQEKSKLLESSLLNGSMQDKYSALLDQQYNRPMRRSANTNSKAASSLKKSNLKRVKEKGLEGASFPHEENWLGKADTSSDQMRSNDKLLRSSLLPPQQQDVPEVEDAMMDQTIMPPSDHHSDAIAGYQDESPPRVRPFMTEPEMPGLREDMNGVDQLMLRVNEMIDGLRSDEVAKEFIENANAKANGLDPSGVGDVGLSNEKMREFQKTLEKVEQFTKDLQDYLEKNKPVEDSRTSYTSMDRMSTNDMTIGALKASIQKMSNEYILSKRNEFQTMDRLYQLNAVQMRFTTQRQTLLDQIQETFVDHLKNDIQKGKEVCQYFEDKWGAQVDYIRNNVENMRRLIDNLQSEVHRIHEDIDAVKTIKEGSEVQGVRNELDQAFLTVEKSIVNIAQQIERNPDLRRLIQKQRIRDFSTKLKPLRSAAGSSNRNVSEMKESRWTCGEWNLMRFMFHKLHESTAEKKRFTQKLKRFRAKRRARTYRRYFLYWRSTIRCNLLTKKMMAETRSNELMKEFQNWKILTKKNSIVNKNLMNWKALCGRKLMKKGWLDWRSYVLMIRKGREEEDQSVLARSLFLLVRIFRGWKRWTRSVIQWHRTTIEMVQRRRCRRWFHRIQHIFQTRHNHFRSLLSILSQQTVLKLTTSSFKQWIELVRFRIGQRLFRTKKRAFRRFCHRCKVLQVQNIQWIRATRLLRSIHSIADHRTSLFSTQYLRRILNRWISFKISKYDRMHRRDREMKSFNSISNASQSKARRGWFIAWKTMFRRCLDQRLHRYNLLDLIDPPPLPPMITPTLLRNSIALERLALEDSSHHRSTPIYKQAHIPTPLTTLDTPHPPTEISTDRIRYSLNKLKERLSSQLSQRLPIPPDPDQILQDKQRVNPPDSMEMARRLNRSKFRSYDSDSYSSEDSEIGEMDGSRMGSLSRLWVRSRFIYWRQVTNRKKEWHMKSRQLVRRKLQTVWNDWISRWSHKVLRHVQHYSTLQDTVANQPNEMEDSKEEELRKTLIELHRVQSELEFRNHTLSIALEDVNQTIGMNDVAILDVETSLTWLTKCVDSYQNQRKSLLDEVRRLLEVQVITTAPSMVSWNNSTANGVWQGIEWGMSVKPQNEEKESIVRMLLEKKRLLLNDIEQYYQNALEIESQSEQKIQDLKSQMKSLGIQRQAILSDTLEKQRLEKNLQTTQESFQKMMNESNAMLQHEVDVISDQLRNQDLTIDLLSREEMYWKTHWKELEESEEVIECELRDKAAVFTRKKKDLEKEFVKSFVENELQVADWSGSYPLISQMSHDTGVMDQNIIEPISISSQWRHGDKERMDSDEMAIVESGLTIDQKIKSLTEKIKSRIGS